MINYFFNYCDWFRPKDIKLQLDRFFLYFNSIISLLADNLPFVMEDFNTLGYTRSFTNEKRFLILFKIIPNNHIYNFDIDK